MSLIDRLFKLFELFIVACLVAMVVMVFGNAVLRKLSDWGILLFGGGIDISEELSRILFVWLTFVGAVVVARENAHLGVDTLVARFGTAGRTVMMVLSDLFVILCCAVFFWGTWLQWAINATNVAPVSRIPMTWVFGVGYFTSIGIGIIALMRLVRSLTGRVTDEELSLFAGEGEAAHAVRERAE
jgi:TRAP-type transport system small permease protein